MNKLLIYAIGNPGRRDDGLAHVLQQNLVEQAAAEWWEDTDFASGYQLSVEDVAMLSQYDAVLITDASTVAPDCLVEHVHPDAARVEFTMHAVSPGWLMAVGEGLFPHMPDVYVLHLPGSEWQLEEGLSPAALSHLPEAMDRVLEWRRQQLSRSYLEPQ